MKKQNGITLIALIITIIVMLILVGVSVSVALNTGLFKTTQGVGKNTQLAREDELLLSNGMINIDGVTEPVDINSYIGSLNGGNGVEILTKGDIIEYVPASNYTSSNKYTVPAEYTGCTGSFYTDIGTDTQWKILEVSGNTIKIIPNAVSSRKLTISGANGWNNSIDALNSVCGAIYGNTTSDKYTATATSIKIEDILGVSPYTPSTSATGIPSINYGSKNCFPIDYLKANGITNPTEKTPGCGYAENSDITVVASAQYQNYRPENRESFDLKFTNWINVGEDYWIANRSNTAGTELAAFYVTYMSTDGSAPGKYVYDSGELVTSGSMAVRPVVTLTLKVNPVCVKTEGIGNEAVNYWDFN